MISLKLWTLSHLALMHFPVNNTSIELPVKTGVLFDTSVCPKELSLEPHSFGNGRGPECHPPTESSDRVGASPHSGLPFGFRLSY